MTVAADTPLDMGKEGVAPATASFAELYQTQLDFVWRSLRHLGVPDALLDDATHEVFLVALRKLELFENRSSVKTWLFGIALRLARNLGRAKQRKFDTLSDELEDRENQGPHELASRSEATATLHRLLSELSVEQRAVFVMIELEQMSAVEVARATGVPLNTVYSRLRLARRDFDAALRRHRALEERTVR